MITKQNGPKMIIAICDGKRVYAQDKPINPECPMCRQNVIGKLGSGKVIPHFAHKPNADCSHSKGESHFHRSLKISISKYLEAKNHKVEVELKIGNRIADIADLTTNIIYEVQISPQDIKSLYSRSSHYAKAGYKTVWILPLKGDVDTSINFEAFTITQSPVIRALYSKKNPPLKSDIAFVLDEGDIYVIMFGRLHDYMLEKTYSEFYEYGELVSFGGYLYKSKRWVNFEPTREIIIEKIAQNRMLVP